MPHPGKCRTGTDKNPIINHRLVELERKKRNWDVQTDSEESKNRDGTVYLLQDLKSSEVLVPFNYLP